MTFFGNVWSTLTKYYSFFLEGVQNTLIIAFFTVLFGTILGILMAMAKNHKESRNLRNQRGGWCQFLRRGDTARPCGSPLGSVRRSRHPVLEPPPGVDPSRPA